MKSQHIKGEIQFFHPETEVEYLVEYEGAYEPACTRGSPDNWTPDNTYLEIIDLHPDLEGLEKRLEELCWEDWESSRDDY